MEIWIPSLWFEENNKDTLTSILSLAEGEEERWFLDHEEADDWNETLTSVLSLAEGEEERWFLDHEEADDWIGTLTSVLSLYEGEEEWQGMCPQNQFLMCADNLTEADYLLKWHP